MNIKNLSAFTAKSDTKQELAGVLVTKDKLVATDSFRLIEVQSEAGKDLEKPIIVKMQKGVKTFDHVTQNTDGTVTLTTKGASTPSAYVLDGDTFPKYEPLIPDIKNAIAHIKLNPQFLKEIAQAFEDLQGKNELNSVHMYVFEEESRAKPVLFTNDKGTARALLMPILK